MIYRYSENKYFQLNLDRDEFLEQLDINKALYNNLVDIEKYIDNWKIALINTYKKEENKVFDLTNSEFFYTSIYLSKFEIRIHFNISEAVKVSRNEAVQSIPIRWFAKDYNRRAFIKFSECKVDKYSSYEFCNMPIIVVPYCLGGYSYLVIDGNHRVTARFNNHIDSIATVVFSVNNTLPLIVSDFEKALYLFLQEGSNPKEFINNSFSKYFL